jgi:hypothetical protein
LTILKKMSAPSRPPKRKATEVAETKITSNAYQTDRIDEVLEDMQAPVVVYRIIQPDILRTVKHTAADYKAQVYVRRRNFCFFSEGKGAQCEHWAPVSQYTSWAWAERNYAWTDAAEDSEDSGDDSNEYSEDRDTSSDEDFQVKKGFLHHKHDALRAGFMNEETDTLIAL